MDGGERLRKVESGREKLEAYKKKKKQKKDKQNDSDSSLSFSSPELPDNTDVNERSISESSTISEHLQSNQSSSGVENDRSLQEIEFPNTNFASIFDNLPADEEYDRISQENKPPSVNSSFRSDTSEKTNPRSDVQAIIEEILHNEVFISSDGEEKSDSVDDVSLNIFEGVSLDDSSINNYVSKLRNIGDVNECFGEKSAVRIDELEVLLRRKDSELLSVGSQRSSSSLNTTATEYKLYQDDYSNRLVDFQHAVAHRDTLIQQLTESLQQSINNREELQKQSENFAKEISLLQKQLEETSGVIKQHRCFDETGTSPKRLLKSDRDDRSPKVRLGSDEGDDNFAQTVTIAQDTKPEMDLELVCEDFEEHLSPNQIMLMNDLKIRINDFVQGKIIECRRSQKDVISNLKEKLLKERSELEAEISRLRDVVKNVKCGSAELMELREELDARHTHEMEELRTYFEKKCADLEKNYSEEIFSQQSRKMSGSSTSSEQELSHDAQHQKPGPGGDADPCNTSKPSTPKGAPKTVTTEDISTVKTELKRCCDLLAKYDEHNLKPEDITSFRDDLSACELPALARLKFDGKSRSEYNAELEILREDYENKLDEVRLENERLAEGLRESHAEQIEGLRFELDEALRIGAAQMSVNAAQEVGSTGDFELTEVLQSYERRLQEQVALAKVDIISALERQIQILANSTDDTEWPAELLQIRNRFAEKYEAEIGNLKERHEEELSAMKEEHFKVLSGALERARRRSLRDNDSSNDADVEIVKDRDTLKKTNTILRNILNELLRYFTKCEDELNKTLIDEIMKYGFDKNITQIEHDLERCSPNNSNVFDDSFTGRRVHLTPNFNEFMTIVDSANTSLLLDAKDLSIDIRNELVSSLERLKTDAMSILALSSKSGDVGGMVTDDGGGLEGELEEVKGYARNLESERVRLENQVEELVAKQRILEEDLLNSNKRISELIECGHKEVVSVGYGQDSRCSSLGGKIANLSELQERARTLVTEWKNGSDHPLLQLVEELCREGERITDEAKKDREDLRQQIEAADKKLRATCQFLEEQAMDREQERDEAQKEITKLREQIKDLEKDKQSSDLVASEVEQLENQMREMTKLIEASERRQNEVEAERKEAIDKIYDLREIIRELEVQVEARTASESELQELNAQLETVVAQQSQALQELTEQLETFKFGPEVNQLKDRIVFLEGEAQKLRLDQELVGSEGALKEIQIRLHEFETSLEKKTRVLEGLHSTLSSTTCSTPSEEMSVRDQIRPNTPNSALEECDVPLQQLARLKEKLIKHSRAEDAAVKRIRDLEMQLHTFKQDLEEAIGEKEILQNQVTEQIVLLSSLQMRLDEQRLRAELNQKQANTSLEVRIYDLENEVQNLKENIRSKEKLVKQLNRIVDETKERLEDRERELSNKEEDEVLVNLQKEIDQLKSENLSLKTKIESDAQNAQILPGLVDNIIADKNADIEKLRDKLDDTQKQLESFLCLNLDHEQLRQLSHLKCSERAFSDILSLADFSSANDQPRKIESRVDNLETSIPFKRNANETTYIGGKFLFEPEISTIPKIDEGDITSNKNSTELTRVDRRVHFEEIEDLKVKLREKDEAIRDYLKKIESIENLEVNVEKLRENLESTENALRKATENFEKEQNDLRVELAEKKINLEQSELDNKRKDDMYKLLAKEKREIELKLNDLQQDLDHYKNFETIISEKNKEIYRLEEQLSKLIESCVALEHYESELSKKQTEFNELSEKYEKLQKDFTENVENLTKLRLKNEETVEENRKLTKELDNQTRLVDNLTKELNAVKFQLDEKSSELRNFENDLKNLRETLVDKNCELEILNEDVARYHSEISNLENRLKNSNYDLLAAKNRKELNERDLEIIKLKTVQDDLNKEIRHLQDYLQEKDRVIEQMQEDTKSLHANLETIQNKIQETGNIVDLRKRLQEEQHLNAVLKEEISGFKRSLIAKERSNSIEDIRGEVEKQLEYSAVLDSNILEALNSPEPTKDSLEKSQLKQEINDLQNKLEQERNTIVKLKSLLEQEKHKCDTIQIEDLNLIEQMRIQLDAALDNVNDLENSLELERKKNNELEFQIERLRANLSPISKTEYKSLPTGESQEILRLKSEITTLNDLVDKLKTEIKTLKKTKNENEATLKYTRDLLELKSGECEKFEVRFEELRRNEMDLREKVMVSGTELEQKIREVENSRQLMGELEQERIEMKKENMIFSERVRELEEEKRIVEVLLRQKEVEMTSTIPEKVLYKMKELTKDVKKQMQENKVMTETLTKMATERSKLLDKIRRLEEQNNNRILCDNTAAKGNHLFGKYLRAESYRKALVFQKCYLIKLLLSYQDVGPISDKLVAFQEKHPTKIKKTGIQRFRCCAISLIAVARMKFLVKRWHSGVRHGAYEAVSPHRQHDTSKEADVVQQNSMDAEARFQVGQPVSSQNFYPSVRSAEQRFSIQIPRTTAQANVDRVDGEEPESPLTEDGHPWSGLTPPQKEKFLSRINTSPSLSPLEAPSLLTEYVKRFNDIQERLGITFEKLNS